MKVIRYALPEFALTILISTVIVAVVPYSVCKNNTMEVVKTNESEVFKTPLHSFKIHVGRFPTSVDGLKALVIDSGIEGWRGPYVEAETTLLDPWGRPFYYRFPGIHNYTSYDLYSLGQDGLESRDDITNWK